MAMKDASNFDICNSFEYYTPQRVYNNVGNHVFAFITWRTWTGSGNISPFTALSTWQIWRNTCQQCV